MMSGKQENKSNSTSSLAASIGTFLFKKKGHSASVYDNDRRGSTDSMGFAVRSKSLENLVDVPPPTIQELKNEAYEEKWEGLEMMKKSAPHVVCILPSVAVDFVTSCLYAIGANPLIPEDVEDVKELISDCKAILVDMSAKQAYIEEFMQEHISGLVPVVVVVSNCGTNDKKKALARQLIEKCEPTILTGRLGDIYALGQDITERAEGIIDNNDDIDLGASNTSITQQNARKSPLPGRRSKSPVTSPHFQKMETTKKQLSRTKTPVPHLLLKGQFRHQSMKHIPIKEAIECGRRLAAQNDCYVHMFEVNTLTCGEFFIEITNSQLGMDNLHSVVQCAAGVTMATLACIDDKGDEISLAHCSQGLALYHVAAQEATSKASSDPTNSLEQSEQLPAAGSLRTWFVDYLHRLDEVTVRRKALIVKHNEVPMGSTK